jgi:hypothetical protein
LPHSAAKPFLLVMRQNSLSGGNFWKNFGHFLVIFDNF